MTRLEKSSQTLLMSLAHSMQSRPFSTKLSPKRTLTLQASQSDEPRIGGMMHGSMVLQMRAPPSTQSRMAALGRRLRSETLTAEGGHPTTSLHHHDSVRLVTIFRDGNQLGPISTKRESARSGCVRLRPGKVASHDADGRCFMRPANVSRSRERECCARWLRWSSMPATVIGVCNRLL